MSGLAFFRKVTVKDAKRFDEAWQTLKRDYARYNREGGRTNMLKEGEEHDHADETDMANTNDAEPVATMGQGMEKNPDSNTSKGKQKSKGVGNRKEDGNKRGLNAGESMGGSKRGRVGKNNELDDTADSLQAILQNMHDRAIPVSKHMHNTYLLGSH